MSIMKKTKIIATLGPATENKTELHKLIHAGVNVFRFNLKHNDYAWHKEVMNRVRMVAKEEGIEVGIFADLQGPELRIGMFPDNFEKITLEEGQEVYLSPQFIKGKFCIPFNEIDLIEDLHPGQRIFIDDGKVELEFESRTKEYIKTKVVDGGALGPRKSVSIPGATINVPTLMPKDKRDIEFAINADVDFIALSFVRDGQDITTLRKIIKSHGGTQKIIAKFETLKAVENMKEIVRESDVIMVARGDLGVEIPFEKVPKIQDQLITECRKEAKPVIVATQMLMSMINNPMPSRAEVADISHAVMQKTDVLMLSDETTIGKFPIKAVQAMSKIARFNEHYEDVLPEIGDFDSHTFEELLIASSIRLAKEIPDTEQSKIKGYIVFTESGRSARVLSRFRSTFPIYAFSAHMHTIRQLTMTYGVTPYHMHLHKNPVTNIRKAIDLLKEKHHIDPGDKIIVVFGQNIGEPGSNNTISIVGVD